MLKTVHVNFVRLLNGAGICDNALMFLRSVATKFKLFQCLESGVARKCQSTRIKCFSSVAYF